MLQAYTCASLQNLENNGLISGLYPLHFWLHFAQVNINLILLSYSTKPLLEQMLTYNKEPIPNNRFFAYNHYQCSPVRFTWW